MPRPVTIVTNERPYAWDFAFISANPTLPVPNKKRVRDLSAEALKRKHDRFEARQEVNNYLDTIKDASEKIAIIQLLRTKDDPRDRQKILRCLIGNTGESMPCTCRYGKHGGQRKNCTCTNPK